MNESKSGFRSSFLDLFRNKKRYWLLPIVVIWLLLGILLLFGDRLINSPFVYAVF